jgi:hypothetical protein
MMIGKALMIIIIVIMHIIKKKENNLLKRYSTEAVECLIFILLSTVTEFHDPSFDFKEKRIPITKIDSLSREDNKYFLLRYGTQ